MESDTFQPELLQSTVTSIRDVANMLYDAFRASPRPDIPPAFTLQPENIPEFIRYVLADPRWHYQTDIVMQLISTIIHPYAWPRPGLPALKIAAGEASKSGVCCRVWTKDELAYKCKTCERDPTCVVCVSCFRLGNHEGHEFAMVRTAGGCCDCGDVQAWSPDGFCSMHSGASPENHDPSVFLPRPLRARLTHAITGVAATILSYCLRLHFSNTEPSVRQDAHTKRVVVMLEWFLKIAHCGDGIRRLMAVLLSSTTEADWILSAVHESGLYDSMNLSPEELKNLSWISLMLRIDGVDRLPLLVQKSLYNFYFQLITDLVFKRNFLKTFVGNYERYVHAYVVSQVAGKRVTEPILNNEMSRDRLQKPGLDIVESFTVQLFTVPALIPVMVRECGLLDVLISLLQTLLETFSAPVHCYENSIPLAESAYAEQYPAVPRAGSRQTNGKGSHSQHSSPKEVSRRRSRLPISSLVRESSRRSESEPKVNEEQLHDEQDAARNQDQDLTFINTMPLLQLRQIEVQQDQELSPANLIVARELSENNLRHQAAQAAIESNDARDAPSDRQALEDTTEGENAVSADRQWTRDPSAHFLARHVAALSTVNHFQGQYVEGEVSEDDIVLDEDEMDVEDHTAILQEASADAGNALVDAAMAADFHEDTSDPQRNIFVSADQITQTREEAEDVRERFDMEQIYVLEHILGSSIPEHTRVCSADSTTSRFKSSVAEARSMAKDAAMGDGIIAHPMRVNWTRSPRLPMDVIFWRVMVDLKYVMCHPQAVYYVVHERPDLFRTFVRTLSMTQGMNPSSRRFGDHVVVEGDVWQDSFRLEIELYHLAELLVVAFCLDEPPESEDMDMSMLSSHPIDLRESRLRCVQTVRTCLEEWLDREEALEALSTFAGEPFTAAHSVSVHIPLHRLLGLLAHHCIRMDGVDLVLALTGELESNRVKDVERLLVHPLRLQVFLAQVRAGMWRRNGRPVIGQSMFYRFVSCSDWFVDLDIFMQQCCAVLMGPEKYIEAVKSAFGVRDLRKLITFSQTEASYEETANPTVSNDQLNVSGLGAYTNLVSDRLGRSSKHLSSWDSHLTREETRVSHHTGLFPLAPKCLRKKGLFEAPISLAMGNSLSELAKFAPTIVEELMVYLVRIVSERTRCGEDEEQVLRKKLIHQLCSRDKTFSQLQRACSYRISNELWRKEEGDTEKGNNYAQALLEQVISSIADYVQPKGMEHGKYALKDEVWTEFDPFSPHFSQKDRCAAEVRQGMICKRLRKPIMVIPEDNVNSRAVYTQFEDLQILLFSLCRNETDGLAAIVLQQSMLSGKGMHSAITTLGAALHIACAAAESLCPFDADLEMSDYKPRESGSQVLPPLALSVVCGMANLIEKSTVGTFLELRPVLHRIVKCTYNSGSPNMKSFLQGTVPLLCRISCSVSGATATDLEEERKKKLRESKTQRQRAAMDRMRVAQANFAKHISSMEDGEENSKEVENIFEIPSETNSQVSGINHVNQSEIEANERVPDHDTNHPYPQTKLPLHSSEEEEKCALCHESSPADNSRLLGLIGFHQQTALPAIAANNRGITDFSSLCEQQSAPSKLSKDEGPGTGGAAIVSELGKEAPTGGSSQHQSHPLFIPRSNRSLDVSGYNNSRGVPLGESTKSYRPLRVHSFVLNSNMLERGVANVPNLHISFCGHAIHINCFERYFSSLLQSRASQMPFDVYNVLDLEKVEFLCPVCRGIANMVLPLMRRNSGEDPKSSMIGTEDEEFSLTFEKWKQRSDLEIRSNWSRQASTTYMLESLTPMYDKHASHGNQKREIAKTVNTLRSSIISRGKAVLQRFGLHTPQNVPLGTGKERPQDRSSSIAASYAKLPSAALSTIVCTEIATRTKNWSLDSVFHIRKKSLKNIIGEARAQMQLEPVSCDVALKELWDIVSPDIDNSVEPLDPFCSFAYLCLLWPAPLTGSEASHLMQVGLVMILRKAQRTIQGNAPDPNYSLGLEILLYLRRVAVLASSYFGSFAPSLVVYGDVADKLPSANCCEEILELLDSLNIPRSSLPSWSLGLLDRGEFAVSSIPFCRLRVGLIKLPSLFQSLLEALEGELCVECQNIPKTPILCLVCGDLLCGDMPFSPDPYHDNCKSGRVRGHSRECGSGVGVFLLLKHTRVLIVRHERITLWGSPYLDTHGEEDRTLSRGKPLILSVERYSVLEELWLFHGFDQDSRILSQTQPARRFDRFNMVL